MTYILLLLGGVLAGIASGLFGIGGGVILVPYMVLVLGFSQIAASGTSLVALLLPVGALGVWQYYSAGKISQDHIISGLIIAAGLVAGVFFGSKIAIGLDETILKRGFAVLLIAVSIRLWFSA